MLWGNASRRFPGNRGARLGPALVARRFSPCLSLWKAASIYQETVHITTAASPSSAFGCRDFVGLIVDATGNHVVIADASSHRGKAQAMAITCLRGRAVTRINSIRFAASIAVEVSRNLDLLAEARRRPRPNTVIPRGHRPRFGPSLGKPADCWAFDFHP